MEAQIVKAESTISVEYCKTLFVNQLFMHTILLVWIQVNMNAVPVLIYTVDDLATVHAHQFTGLDLNGLLHGGQTDKAFW